MTSSLGHEPASLASVMDLSPADVSLLGFFIIYTLGPVKVLTTATIFVASASVKWLRIRA